MCEFHFKTEDIRITLGVGKKKLVADAVPSIFKIETNKARRRPPPKERHIPSSSSSKSEEVISESEESVVVSADQFDGEISQEVTELDILKRELKELREKIQEFEQRNDFLSEENEQLFSYKYRYENLHKHNELFRTATGLEVENFDILFEFLDPEENCINMKF